jgi:hypothetical protein
VLVVNHQTYLVFGLPISIRLLPLVTITPSFSNIHNVCTSHEPFTMIRPGSLVPICLSFARPLLDDHEHTIRRSNRVRFHFDRKQIEQARKDAHGNHADICRHLRPDSPTQIVVLSHFMNYLFRLRQLPKQAKAVPERRTTRIQRHVNRRDLLFIVAPLLKLQLLCLPKILIH